MHSSFKKDIFKNNRLIFNPNSIIVEKHTASILKAHLLNFLFVAHMMYKQDKFVFMSTNQVIFKPGIEEWVSKFSMSFCKGQNCTDLYPYESPKVFFPSFILEKLSIRESMSTWYIRYEEALCKKKIKHLDCLYSNFFPHEGSFYPKYVLSDFTQKIYVDNQGIFSSSHCSSLYPPMPTKMSLRGFRRSSVLLAGECSMEELLLPTFVFQYYSSLIPFSTVPIVLRLWTTLNLNFAVNKNWIRNISTSSHTYFALKVPRHEFPHTHIALNLS